jgi:hypothetical protein
MMDRYELKETLSKGIVTVTFEKLDGTIREMRCTLQADILPPMLLQEVAKPRAENPNVLSVWDIESHGWRSFRIDSIKSIVVT